MSTILSYKDYFRKTVVDINEQIQALMTTQALPLWINPINTKFYTVNGYKVGDIVIAISDEQLVIEYLEPYIKKIAEYVGMDSAILLERNNWQIDDQFYNTIIYGGNILPHLKLQPLTVMSTNVHGFDIYISTKGDQTNGYNYDMPGMSDAWLNLRTQSNDAINLMIDSIVEKIEESTVLPDIFDDFLQQHLTDYHFGANVDDPGPTEIELTNYLNKLELLHSTRRNSTNDTIRMPFIQDGVGTIGQTLLINSSSNDYIASSIINIDKVNIDEPITMSFIPNDNLKIVLPTILEFDDDYIETDTNSISMQNGISAVAINALYNMNNVTSVIYRSLGDQTVPLTLMTMFMGFNSVDQYTVNYTPIGKTTRVDRTEIQCMPVEELKRTTTSITFKINPKYVWKTNALNICVSGIKAGA